MTHLEVFTWNVIEGKSEKGIYPVVFDYQKRSPLTNDALAVPVELADFQKTDVRESMEESRKNTERG